MSLLLLLAGCATLGRGETLYRSRCSSCHMLIPAKDYSREGWRYALDRYGKHLTTQEKEEIMTYLVEHGARP